MSITDGEGNRAAAYGAGQGEGHGRGGYLRVFKHLRQGELATVRHGMGTQPLVDVYELQRFSAVVSADETVEPAAVHFYLYHRTDATVRVRGADGSVSSVTVDDPRDPSYRIPFAAALREAGLEAGAETHLGDLVVEFWKAFFAPPSDPFDEESYANSRWLDRHVGDRRSLDEVRTGGGWDDLWLMYRPRKTLNWPHPTTLAPMPATQPGIPQPTQPIGPVLDGDVFPRPVPQRQLFGAPPGVEVTHLGLDTVGLRLLPGGPPSVAVMALLRA